MSNASNNPSIYFVSNTQWEVGIGVHIYISNNSSQANIAIRVTVIYIKQISTHAFPLMVKDDGDL